MKRIIELGEILLISLLMCVESYAQYSGSTGITSNSFGVQAIGTGKLIEIIFDANGGAFADGETSKTVEYWLGENEEVSISNVEEPKKSGSLFGGWYNKSGVEVKKVSDSTTLYVKWKSPKALLNSGFSVIEKIKTLANGTKMAYSDNDTNIKKIVLSNEYQSGEYTNIESRTSDWEIRAYYEDGVVYIATEADGIVLDEDSSYLFYGLNSLENIDLDGLDTSQVKFFEGMFEACSSIKEIDLSWIDTSNATSMIGMFDSCSSLESIDLSKFSTSNVTNMGNMFARCESLTSLDLSSFDTSKVSSMEAMFRNCKNISRLDLTTFDTLLVKNMNYLFEGCSSLEEIRMDDLKVDNLSSIIGMFADMPEDGRTCYVYCTDAANVKFREPDDTGVDLDKVVFNPDGAMLLAMRSNTVPEEITIVKGE